MIFLPDGRSEGGEGCYDLRLPSMGCRASVRRWMKGMKLILDNVVLQRRQLEIKIWRVGNDGELNPEVGDDGP